MKNIEKKISNSQYNPEQNVPILFQKKIKINIVKPLTHIENDTGITRHYTPAAQEWFNSVYAFNKNLVKDLPVNDINLFNILKAYFNLQLKKNYLKTKRIVNRFKRLATKRIFIGRGDIKHTFTNVIITFYVHNVERFYLKRAIKLLILTLYRPVIKLRKYVAIVGENKKVKISYNRPLSLDEFSAHPRLIFKYFKHYNKKLKREFRDNKLDNKSFSINYLDRNILETDIRNLIISNFNISCKLYIKYSSIRLYRNNNNKILNRDLQIDILNLILANLNTLFPEMKNKFRWVNRYNILETIINDKLISWVSYSIFNPSFFSKYKEYRKIRYIRHLRYLEAWLELNKNKFINSFDSSELQTKMWKHNSKIPKFNFLFFKLKEIVENIYNKKVIFNIINLNYMHLNSDIYTQAVALKLRNKNNKLYRVLKSSLRKVKIPRMSRMAEKVYNFNKNDLLINKIRNDNISSMFSDNNVKDPLSNLLLNFFPDANNLIVNVVNKASIKIRSISIQKYVIKILKHLNLRGVRIEAKGRITRRLTASRSVFKMKYKGGLKNVDSSFKGIPAIILRGNIKSNVEYSFISSKHRNGAFGVKGWVSSK